MGKRFFVQKIRNRLHRMRLQPIRVFCFHHVSDTFEPDTMWKCDWMQTEDFKRSILALKKKYAFISLLEITEHMRNDRFRIKRYAALTADDGWASLKNIIPWLAEQKIPVTLFLNPLYLDGVHHQERETEELLTKEEVEKLVEVYKPYITIASHGWTHKDCLKMTNEEFAESVNKSEQVLVTIKGKIPFYAFTYGRHKPDHLKTLKKNGLLPVFMDGELNYNDSVCIHRELLVENN